MIDGRCWGEGGLGGGARRKRHHTWLKIINRFGANAPNEVGSRTVWSISSVH